MFNKNPIDSQLIQMVKEAESMKEDMDFVITTMDNLAKCSSKDEAELFLETIGVALKNLGIHDAPLIVIFKSWEENKSVETYERMLKLGMYESS